MELFRLTADAKAPAAAKYVESALWTVKARVCSCKEYATVIEFQRVTTLPLV